MKLKRSDLIKLLETLTKYGVTSYKDEDIQLSLDSAKARAVEEVVGGTHLSADPRRIISTPVKEEKIPGDDEMLFASVELFESEVVKDSKEN